jgi:hypothetical protein
MGAGYEGLEWREGGQGGGGTCADPKLVYEPQRADLI